MFTPERACTSRVLGSLAAAKRAPEPMGTFQGEVDANGHTAGSRVVPSAPAPGRDASAPTSAPTSAAPSSATSTGDRRRTRDEPSRASWASLPMS